MKRLTREDWKDPGSKMWEKVMDFGLPVEKEKAIIDALRKLAMYEDAEEEKGKISFPQYINSVFLNIAGKTLRVNNRCVDYDGGEFTISYNHNLANGPYRISLSIGSENYFSTYDSDSQKIEEGKYKTLNKVGGRGHGLSEKNDANHGAGA